MSHLARIVVAFSLLGPCANAARSQAVGQAKAPDVKAIDALVSEQVKQKGLIGVSLAVMHEGKPLLVKGYGKSSLEPDRPVQPDTLFAIGSITKQFTCACILLLAEDGKLSVHDKVAKYYPNLTRANDIDLYDLMSHRAGYPDYYPLDFVDRRMFKPIAVDQMIHEYATTKLDFEPRTRWSYSNTGFVLLGRIVEKISGEPFAKFLERRILKPLGMEHTEFEPREPGPRLATGYTWFALGPPEIANLEAPGWIFSAGAVYSTAGDLLKWDLALMDGKVLKPESYQLMTTSAKLADGKLAGYGCGLSVTNRQGVTVLAHGGAVGGFVAHNSFLPSTRSAVVLLTNNEEFISTGALNQKLLEPLLKKPAAAPKPGAAINTDQARRVIPKISGPGALDAAKSFLGRLTQGEVDRSQLGEEFSYFLSAARLQGVAKRLKALGEPIKIAVESTSERGGMEVATVRFTYKSIVIKTLMYRTPDGKIQEFLVLRG